MILPRNKLIFILSTLKCQLFTKRNKYYQTTPIFYVNAKPHIGHLYTTVIADAIYRHKKLKSPSEELFFMTGTDEHGLKIQNAAKEHKTSELQYVNHISNMYRDLFGVYNIQYTDFLRTSERRHVDCVTNIWKKLVDNGHIYLGDYSGWYCTADEAFVPELQLQILPDGTKVTLDGSRPVEFVQERNYKFKLSSFKDQLLDWLSKAEIKPNKFHKIVDEWVSDGSVLEDISVSRPKSRVNWGITVPGDDTQVVYVWLDALACYLTSVGYPGPVACWPPDLQIIGKDILKFHCIYWPAFLLGVGLSPPRQFLCHSHWVINGEKMSKSKGNVVDPRTEGEKFTTEGFRYFLLREGVPHCDGNYTSVKIQRILNAELADTLGNLLNRCTGTLVNSKQVFPSFNEGHHKTYCASHCQQLLESTQSLPDLVDEHFSNYEFYKGIDAIIATLHLANGFFEREKPWELRKDPANSEKLSSILHITMEVLRVCGILLTPIVPELSSKLLSKLQVPVNKRHFSSIHPLSWNGSHSAPVPLSSERVTLFPRLTKG